MLDVILFLLSVLIFISILIIKQFEIDELKEELKLEKAKVEFYKSRRNWNGKEYIE